MEKFVIEIGRNNRTFWICWYEDRIQLTWDKKFAKKFDSEEDAQTFISENRDFKYCRFHNSNIVKF